jgi:hypothetical protein
MVSLQIIMKIAPNDRAKAAEVYSKYKRPFLESIPGARSKELLVRDEDVQVVHGFDTKENAASYLKSSLFKDDVVSALKPYLIENPDIRIYQIA